MNLRNSMLLLAFWAWAAAPALKACEVTGEVFGPGSAWKYFSKEYPNAQECKAAVQEAEEKYGRYYRNLQCEGCEEAESNNSQGQENNSTASSSQELARKLAQKRGQLHALTQQRKFKEDKQDALNQLKGVAGDSESAVEEGSSNEVSPNLNGPNERSRKAAGRGIDERPGGAKPKPVTIHPASFPTREETMKELKTRIKGYRKELEKKKKKIQELDVKITQAAVKQDESAEAAAPAENKPEAVQPEAAPVAPSPTVSQAKPAAGSLDDLQDQRQAALADQADLEKKIGESQTQYDALADEDKRSAR